MQEIIRVLANYEFNLITPLYIHGHRPLYLWDYHTGDKEEIWGWGVMLLVYKHKLILCIFGSLGRLIMSII